MEDRQAFESLGRKAHLKEMDIEKGVKAGLKVLKKIQKKYRKYQECLGLKHPEWKESKMNEKYADKLSEITNHYMLRIWKAFNGYDEKDTVNPQLITKNDFDLNIENCIKKCVLNQHDPWKIYREGSSVRMYVSTKMQNPNDTCILTGINVKSGYCKGLYTAVLKKPNSTPNAGKPYTADNFRPITPFMDSNDKMKVLWREKYKENYGNLGDGKAFMVVIPVLK